jgi:hypothetical protein
LAVRSPEPSNQQHNKSPLGNSTTELLWTCIPCRGKINSDWNNEAPVLRTLDIDWALEIKGNREKHSINREICKKEKNHIGNSLKILFIIHHL